MRQILPIIFTAFIIISCSKKDPEPPVLIDSPNVDIKFDQEHEFTLKKGTEVIVPSTFTWTSSDVKVGTINASGIFTGRKIGKSEVKGVNKDGKTVTSQVVVSPYQTFLVEPVIQFGASKATIKAAEKRTLDSEFTSTLYFNEKGGQVLDVVYTFDGGKMDAAFVIFRTTQETVDSTLTFYMERYPNVSASDTAIFFSDDEQTRTILVTVHADLGFVAAYFPYIDGFRINSAYPNGLPSLFDELKSFSKQSSENYSVALRNESLRSALIRISRQRKCF